MKSNSLSPDNPPNSRETALWKRWRNHLLLQEDLNFLLTNRIPRIAVTRLMGRISRIRNRTWTRLCLRIWNVFADLDLSDAASNNFSSLHECFTRALRPGARPVDPRTDILVSPCDAIVGECGFVDGDRLYQAKGFPYELGHLFGNTLDAAPFINGTYCTLRLTATMYHRFHAPDDAEIQRVTYISGDVWNVNPIALRRVERLFCRNERATLHMQLANGHPLALVAVAAVLVASIQLHFVPVRLHLRHRGLNPIPCAARVRRGEELGWFEHGSTIIVFAPHGFKLCSGIEPGATLRMGAPLLEIPQVATPV